MSQYSCIQALKTILQDQVPELGLVTDIEETMNTLPPDASPYAIILDPRVDEVRLSGGYGGGKKVDFPLEIHIFLYYSDVNANTAQQFRQTIDKVQSVIRSAHRLNNLGDTHNSQVLFFGERLSTVIDPWTEDSGVFLFHAMITAWVEEIATDSVFNG